MKATIFDKRFDAGEDVSDQIDWSRSKRPNTEHSRVNVDFPAWVVKGLDQHAQFLGGNAAIADQDVDCGPVGVRGACVVAEGPRGGICVAGNTGSSAVKCTITVIPNAKNRAAR